MQHVGHLIRSASLHGYVELVQSLGHDPHDTLIAATALRHQATLVTRNVREFSCGQGLQCLNWHQP